MLITLNQLKASLVAFKNWVVARIPSKTSDLTNDSDFVTTADIPTKVSDLVDDSGHYTKPSGGIPASDLASGVIPTIPVQDVQINGTSIVDNGVANIPIASASNFGVAKTNSTNGVYADANGVLTLSDATDLSLRLGNNTKYAVNTARQHAAAFYGLAKAAGDTTQSAASSNPVGTYTAEAKSAIQTMLGVDTAISEAMSQVTVDAIPTTEIDTLFA